MRELQNVMERLAVLTRDSRIRFGGLSTEIRQCESWIANVRLRFPDEEIDLEEIEKEIVLQALDKHGRNWTRGQLFKHQPENAHLEWRSSPGSSNLRGRRVGRMRGLHKSKIKPIETRAALLLTRSIPLSAMHMQTSQVVSPFLPSRSLK